MTARLFIVACIALLLVPVGARGAQEALPQVVVDRLTSQRDEADAALRSERARLAPLAANHLNIVATSERAKRDLTFTRGVLDAFPGAPRPAAYITAVADHEGSEAQQLRRVTAKLDAATQRAARAQGRSLDADRRLRAVQRAAATQDDINADIGSYQFGSGGPAVSAASLDQYLGSKASAMTGSGKEFLEAGIEFDVDPRLLVAIAGAESYFGLTICAPHNAWGWGCPSGPFRFDTWADGIETVARGLRKGYLNDGLTTVGEIHLRYAPPAAANDPTGLNYAWANNVAKFLVEQGGDPQAVTGLRPPSR